VGAGVYSATTLERGRREGEEGRFVLGNLFQPGKNGVNCQSFVENGSSIFELTPFKNQLTFL